MTNNVAKPRGLDAQGVTLLDMERCIGMAMRSLDERIGFCIILHDRQTPFWRWITRSREKIEFPDCRPATRTQENGSERQDCFPVRWNAKNVRLHMAWRVSIQERCHHTHLKRERECESQRKLEEGVEEVEWRQIYADC